MLKCIDKVTPQVLKKSFSRHDLQRKVPTIVQVTVSDLSTCLLYDS